MEDPGRLNVEIVMEPVFGGITRKHASVAGVKVKSIAIFARVRERADVVQDVMVVVRFLSDYCFFLIVS